MPSVPNFKLVTPEIAWAAGFLEGEGCFGWYGGGVTPEGHSKGRGYPLVAASQIDREPLEKLAAIFDGTLRKQTRTTNRYGNQVWEFRATGLKAVLIMQAVVPLLSQRKANRVIEALLRWHERQAELAHDKLFCPQGHPRDEANLAYRANGHRRCRVCERGWHETARERAAA